MQRHLVNGIESKCRQNTKTIWPYSSSRLSKVIYLSVNGKPIGDLILVINCNFSHICYRFRWYSRLAIKNCWFTHTVTPPLFDAPSAGTPRDINVIYTSLKSAFNWLQFRRWHYRSLHSSSRCCLLKSRNHAIRQNLSLQQFKVIQSKVINQPWNQIESSHTTFY